MLLRPYQLAAVQFLHPRRRGFIVAPAGSGKTCIAAEAASDYARTFDKVVWLANTREQCDQFLAAFEAVLSGGVTGIVTGYLRKVAVGKG